MSEQQKGQESAMCGSLDGVRGVPATWPRRCADCGRTLPRGRAHRQYCGGVCRARASRRRKEQHLAAVSAAPTVTITANTSFPYANLTVAELKAKLRELMAKLEALEPDA